VVRFVTDGGSAHNVSFPAAENAGAAGLPAATPYVTAAGQSVDVAVTMDAGTYTFQCDPHAMMGMKGKLIVTE
jgi:plastocyanin